LKKPLPVSLLERLGGCDEARRRLSDADEARLLERVLDDEEGAYDAYVEFLYSRDDKLYKLLIVDGDLARLGQSTSAEAKAGRKALRKHLKDVSPPFWARISRTSDRVLNCGLGDKKVEVEFAVRCPQLWTDLEETSDDNVRSCSVCDERVYACATYDELSEKVAQGKCVMINNAVIENHNDEWAGVSLGSRCSCRCWIDKGDEAMSWNQGHRFMEAYWTVLQKYVPEEEQPALISSFIELLTDNDCDPHTLEGISSAIDGVLGVDPQDDESDRMYIDNLPSLLLGRDADARETALESCTYFVEGHDGYGAKLVAAALLELAGKTTVPTYARETALSNLRDLAEQYGEGLNVDLDALSRLTAIGGRVGEKAQYVFKTLKAYHGIEPK